jgi:hypothetical protein
MILTFIRHFYFRRRRFRFLRRYDLRRHLVFDKWRMLHLNVFK